MANMYQVPILLPTPAPVLSVVPSNMQVPSHQINPINFPQSCTASTNFQVQRAETLIRHASSLPLLNHQEFNLIQPLGEGASGIVYLARRKNTLSQVAVKVYCNDYISIYSMPDSMPGGNFKYEASILSILQDTGFVPQVYGFFPDPSIQDKRMPGGNFKYKASILSILQDTDFVQQVHILLPAHSIQGKTMLVQEFFGNGRTLMSILRDPNIVLNSANKIYIAYQLVCGLKAIHDKGVLVNDIKSNNVLVDTKSMPPYQIRYIDFDLATYGEGTRYLLSTAKYVSTISKGLSACWLAPEVRMGHQTTQQSDIYSVGYLISELECLELHEIVSVCTQEKPYDRPNLNEIFNIISPLYFNSQKSQQNLMPSVTYPTVATPYGPLSMY